MSNFTFDEEWHCYKLDGKPLPSVTRILKPLYDFSAVHPEVLKRAGDFGTAVHKTIELYLRDDLDEDVLDENLYNPLLAFKAWQADNYEFDLETARLEAPDYHAKLKYTGTPDIDAESFVIDLKSRKCNPAIDSLQILAYDHMTGSGKRGNYVLELKQDASYVFTALNTTDRERKANWSKFRYLLDFYNMGKEIERWKK